MAALAIVGALGMQHLGGLVPCALCLEQRLPYYAGVPFLALVLFAWNRMPPRLLAFLLLLPLLAFAWGAWMGGYHAGVEWGYWPGPTSCSGTLSASNIDISDLLDMKPVISCEAVQFRFVGISLAGFNFLVSSAVVVLLAASAKGLLFRR